MLAASVSQLVLQQVLNAVSVGVLENVSWKNNVSFKKDTEKVVL